MDRSLWAVLAGTFTLRFSTGLTGAMLTYYLAEFDQHHGVLDQLLGLPPSPIPDAVVFGLIAATFYASELILSPVFGVLSDRRGHWQVMQWGPIFGLVAVVITWATVNVPLILGTRLLEGAATAASIPSILGFIAVATAMDEGLRGKVVARFEAATLAGLLAGFAVAGPLFEILGTVGFLVNGVLYLVSLSIYRWGVDRNLEASLEAPHAKGTSALDFSRYRRILGQSHVWLIAPTWVAINAVLGLFTTQTIFQLVRTPDPKFADQLLMGGFEPNQISAGLVVGGLLFFAGLIYWGSKFKDLRRTTIILYGVGGGALLVIGAIGINHSANLPARGPAGAGRAGGARAVRAGRRDAGRDRTAGGRDRGVPGRSRGDHGPVQRVPRARPDRWLAHRRRRGDGAGARRNLHRLDGPADPGRRAARLPAAPRALPRRAGDARLDRLAGESDPLDGREPCAILRGTGDAPRSHEAVTGLPSPAPFVTDETRP